MRIVKLTEETRKDLLSTLLRRSPNQYGEYEGTVARIVDDVRERGDEALFEYTEKFDHIKLTPETVQVTEQEIEEAYREVDPALLDVIRKALVNIRSYHEKQRRSSWFDSQENRRRLPILERIASERKVIVTAVALAYLWSGGVNAFPIIGAKNKAQLADSLSVGEMTLTEEECTAIRKGAWV